MRMRKGTSVSVVLVVVPALASLFALGACSGGTDAAVVNGGVASDAGDTPIADGSASADAGPSETSVPGDGAAQTQAVTFTYAPRWRGVTSVTVVGGFGQADDWDVKAPLVTLTNDGTGTFRGTAQLRAGSYLYLLRAVGDDDALMPAVASTLAVDPNAPSTVPCPAASPSFTAKAPNPCSVLVVPSTPTTPATFHVRGVVTASAGPAKGYLVNLDRFETGQHHFFVNRMTTAADGMFDLTAVAGQYRVRIVHPSSVLQTDVARDPLALKAYDTVIAEPFPLAADMTVQTPDMAFTKYATYAPNGAAPGALPTAFTFTTDGPARFAFLLANAQATSAAGDPVFTSPPGAAGGFVFDGRYKAAGVAATVTRGATYFWRTDTTLTTASGGAWKASSMPFAIRWP